MTPGAASSAKTGAGTTLRGDNAAGSAVWCEIPIVDGGGTAMGIAIRGETTVGTELRGETTGRRWAATSGGT